jgi:hypothetical protein
MIFKFQTWFVMWNLQLLNVNSSDIDDHLTPSNYRHNFTPSNGATHLGNHSVVLHIILLIYWKIVTTSFRNWICMQSMNQLNMECGGLVFLFGCGGKDKFFIFCCSQMFLMCSSMVFPVAIHTGSSMCRIIEVRFCYT